MIFYIVIVILMFGLLIIIHELGHFMFAKLFGVGINEFSVGMGPKIVSKTGKDGVMYSLRALPIGGYVSMVGEDDDGDGAKNALCNKKAWQRFIIIAAGAVMNILLGFVIMGFLVGFGGKLYSTTIERFNFGDENGNLIQMTEWQGLRVGDEIIKVGNRRINVRSDLVFEAMDIGAEPCTLTVLRGGQKVKIENFVFPTYTEKGIVFGNASFFLPTTLAKTPAEVVKQSFCQSVAVIRMIWTSLVNTVRGKYGTEAVSGPVGVVSEIKETATYGFSALCYMMMIISMNLGIFNLLPLPALDGGRLFFVLIEMIRGKPVNPKYEGYVHLAGMVLLLSLMVLVTFNDIAKLVR